MKKNFIAVFLGSVIEYYDYALYGFAASFLNEYFFPKDTSLSPLVAVFSVFALGSVAKPLGALIFGHIGDRYGRKIALNITILGIGFPTLIIGLLPSFESWGYYSLGILIACRILQGVFVGGEADGARVYLFEHLGDKRPCLTNSLNGLSYLIGIYLASFAFFVGTQFLSHPWIWKIPFLGGGILGIVTLFLRQFIEETPAFLKHSSSPKSSVSFLKLSTLNHHLKCLAPIILICGSVGGIYHFYLVFFGSYLFKILHIITEKDLGIYMWVGALIFAGTGPFWGWIADKVGARRFMMASLWGCIGLGLMNAIYLSHDLAPLWLFILTAFAISAFSVPGYVLLMKCAPLPYRYRFLSLGHAIGSMLFSGTAPLIASLLWQHSLMPWMPFLYFLFLLILSGLGLWMLAYPHQTYSSKDQVPTQIRDSQKLLDP